MTESERLEKLIDRLKQKYFASKYTTLASFAKYSGEWPEELNYTSFTHWNKEKFKLRELKAEQEEVIQQNYKYTLIERINFSTKLMEVVENTLLNKLKAGEIEIKDLNQYIKAAAHVSDLQDKTMVVMKIDPSVDKQYQENAAAIDALLDVADIDETERQELKNEIELTHKEQQDDTELTQQNETEEE